MVELLSEVHWCSGRKPCVPLHDGDEGLFGESSWLTLVAGPGHVQLSLAPSDGCSILLQSGAWALDGLALDKFQVRIGFGLAGERIEFALR